MVLAVGRWLRSRVVVALLLTSAFFAFLSHHQHGKETVQPIQKPVYPNQAFHLLVPATSSNVNFCKLLLSAAVNRYPVPIIINWGAKENKDAYVQHLAKVWTILDYLEVMMKRGQKDDLVLIIDGFDIHFQLPPEVIISRYFSENERANKRIDKQLGAEVAADKGIRQTVIFGHDKLCWPTDWKRPACWLVPEASDPKKAYGPLTDSNPTVSRARWLNSGTILGPVEHVRDIFRATLDLIHRNHTTDSDQFYFANIWAEQEHARHLYEKEPYKTTNKIEKDFPDLIPGNRTEYFFGLDYEGVLFQTMAFFREFIVWETFDGVLPETVSSIWKASNKHQQIIKRDPYYLKVLPSDIALARSPFSAVLEVQKQQKFEDPERTLMAPDLVTSALPTNTTWRNISLGVNANSNQIFPLLHFTGPKEFRRKWWPRMWFLPWAEELLRASVKAPRAPLSERAIGGKLWWAGVPWEATKTVDVTWEEKGGAWADGGHQLGWEFLCKPHEGVVFGREVEGMRKPVKEGEKKDGAPAKEGEKKEEVKTDGGPKVIESVKQIEPAKQAEKVSEEGKEDLKKEEEKKEGQKKEGEPVKKEGKKEDGKKEEGKKEEDVKEDEKKVEAVKDGEKKEDTKKDEEKHEGDAAREGEKKIAGIVKGGTKNETTIVKQEEKKEGEVVNESKKANGEQKTGGDLVNNGWRNATATAKAEEKKESDRPMGNEKPAEAKKEAEKMESGKTEGRKNEAEKLEGERKEGEVLTEGERKQNETSTAVP